MNNKLYEKLKYISENFFKLTTSNEGFEEMRLSLDTWDCSNDTLTLEFKLYLRPNGYMYVSLDDFKVPNLYTMTLWIDQVVCRVFTNCENTGGVTHLPKYEVEKVKDGLYKIELKDYRQYKVRG